MRPGFVVFGKIRCSHLRIRLSVPARLIQYFLSTTWGFQGKFFVIHGNCNRGLRVDNQYSLETSRLRAEILKCGLQLPQGSTFIVTFNMSEIFNKLFLTRSMLICWLALMVVMTHDHAY